MTLSEYLDVERLCSHVNQHLVNVQHHPVLPLAIYNYGAKAQFSGAWDDVTVKTRGLIVDQSTDEVVARPFQKFFNLASLPETQPENLPAHLPELTTKLDGSLGVLYRYKGFVGISTRGSFASDQAAWASQWYGKHLAAATWPEGWTPLFEIIYPENRIVVKYDWEGLALLALVNNETGQEISHPQLVALGSANGVRVVELHNKNIVDAAAENARNEEGYVATWHRDGAVPLRVKIKFQDYVRLHRLLTSISPKQIWEMLRDGQSFDELYDGTPAHYQEWVNYWRDGLLAEYGRIEQRAKGIYATCPLPKDGTDKAQRKALAQFFTAGDRRNVSPILFQMLDGQPFEGTIWKMCRNSVADREPFRANE